jgi:soluble lytic murein transglycosylase-like protein
VGGNPARDDRSPGGLLGSQQPILARQRSSQAMTSLILSIVCASWCPRHVEARARVLGPLVELAAERERVRPALLASLVAHESSAMPWRVSRAGAIGYAQVMPGTAASVCRGLRWRHVRLDNVLCGARILRAYLRECGSEVEAVGAYNSGHCVASTWARRVARSAK